MVVSLVVVIARDPIVDALDPAPGPGWAVGAVDVKSQHGFFLSG